MRTTKKDQDYLSSNWSTTADIFDEGKRRGAGSQLKLHEAFHTVFDRRKEHVDLVLADLAEFSGYYFVTPPGASNEFLRQMEGRREVFARILSLIALPMTQLEALWVAAVEETQTSNTEGER